MFQSPFSQFVEAFYPVIFMAAAIILAVVAGFSIVFALLSVACAALDCLISALSKRFARKRLSFGSMPPEQ